jgi:uncharacterized Zn-finger protein
MSALPSTPGDGAVTVTAQDLHGGRAVFCPNPKMPLWSGHPRVFLDIATTGQAQCPYCGTRYRLAPGATTGSGH